MIPTNLLPNNTLLKEIQDQAEARFFWELEIGSGFGKAYMLMKLHDSQTAEIMRMVYINAVKDVMEDYLNQCNIFSPTTSKNWINFNENNPVQEL